MSFEEWIFDSLIQFGAIRDYSKNPPSGKGKQPKGSISLQPVKISELRKSTNPDEQLWGLVGSPLVGLPEVPRVTSHWVEEFQAYAQKFYSENPNKLVEIMQKASIGAWHQYKKNYKENQS